MAVAEARAAWQRTANRCFVQEDAKRAPKLACCPSASSTASKQSDAGQANPTEGQDHPNPGFVPPNRNPSHTNLPTESKWWLQMQPNYGHHRCLTNEQLNTLDMDIDSGPQLHNNDHKMEESLKVKKKDVDDDEVCFDSDSGWLGGEKSEPWWRKADRDELAMFVAQRSLDHHIENCDLPQPQKTRAKMDPFAHIGTFDGNNGIGMFSPSKDFYYNNKAQCVSLPNPIVHKRSNVSSGSECGKKWASVEGYSHFAREKSISDYTTTHKKETTEMQIDGNDPSKAQLLEALRHSQTRAREAEKAAQQAYAEKEHILKLFFRQASHLFAYKQWLQLLQLENFYFELKNNNDHSPSGLPFLLPQETHKLKKNSPSKPSKGKRAKRTRNTRCNIISKYAFFALGLSLVGAGLLLGWTVGWMLPAL